MANLKLVGAVAIKIRPDAKGFRKEAEDQLGPELRGLEPTVEVKVKVKADTKPAKKDVDDAGKEIEKRTLNLKVALDHDSVKAAQKALDDALAHLDDVKITVDLDDQGSIDDAQERLDALAVGAKVQMEFAPDEKGFRAVLAKIEQLRREKITQEIEFDTDDDSLNRLEAATKAALHEGKIDVITVSYNNNRASMLAALAQIKAEQQKLKVFEFDVVVNKKSLKTARQLVEASLRDTPMEFRVDYDDQESLKRVRANLQSMLNEVRSKTLAVKFDENEIRAEIAKINDLIHDEVQDQKVEIPVHASRLEIVARQLQFASRARRVPFFVVIDAKSVAIAEGLLRSLSGVNTLQSFGRTLENIITKFDTFSLKTAGWSTAIGSLIDSLFFMTSSLFTVGDGMLEVVGLAAVAPAAFATLAAVLTVGIAVFKDFGAAVHGIDAALKRLPPAGQKAALEIRNVFATMREAISVEFWEKASDAMLRFTERALPVFTTGLVKTSSKLGSIFGQILDSFTKVGDAGQLNTMFDNLTTGLQNAVRGAGALFDAFNILGLRGSEFLPKFFTWLSDITEKFRDWLIISDKNGDITAWINDGVTALKDMFFSAGAIIDQFKAVARAAGLVGPNGLDDFRRNMEHIARLMLGEPWQTQMASVFSGARQGAHELADGVKDLFGAMKDSAFWTGQLLTLLGQLGGDILSGFATTIRNLTFQQGFLDSIRGMSQMVRDMTPAFDNLGNVIGRMSTIASNAFRGLAPIFNSVLSILDGATSTLATNLGKIVPDLLNLTNNLINFARGPIQLVVNILNGFLGAVNALPGPLRDATVAFLVFLALRNQFGAFVAAIGPRFTKMTTTLVRDSATIVSGASGNFTRMADGSLRQVVRMADGTNRQMTRLGSYISTGTTRANAAVLRFRADHIPTTLASAAGRVSGIVGKINGSLSLIGGIPGLVLGLVGVLIATLGGNAARASAQIDQMKDSLDKSTKEATVDTLAHIAREITNISEAGDGFANFWRGVVNGAKAGNETIDALGISVNSVAKIITGNRKQYDTFIGQMRDLGNVPNLKDVGELMRGKLPTFIPLVPGDENTNQSQRQLDLIRKAAQAAKELKLSPDLFDDPKLKSSLLNLNGQLEEQRRMFDLSQLAAKLYGDSLGVTSIKAAEVAAITQQLGDRSIEASGKIDAIRRSLDLLNGGGQSAQTNQFVRMDELEAGLENARAIADSVKKAGADIIGTDGLLNSQSKVSRDIFRILREEADNVLVQAQSSFDAAIKNGDTAKAAVEKAMATVNVGKGDLAKFEQALGVPLGSLKKQFDTFFGADWTLEATFIGRPDLFLAAAKEATAAGVKFDKEKFIAFLLANGDPATITVDDVRAYIQQFANGEYKAKLQADKLPAIGEIALALGKADEYANGDYQAVMQALNNAAPGVNEALLEINRLIAPNDPFRAILYTLLNQGSLSFVQNQLALLARPILIQVGVNTSDLNRDAAAAGRGAAAAAQAAANRQRAASVPTGFRQPVPLFNGGILSGYGIKAFANGGIENHIAQISRANGPVRIWGERETQGEAYVPLAASKRPRSVKILGEVARRFGYQLSQAQKFADGGTVTQGVSSARPVPTTSVSVGTINTVDPETAVKKLRMMQQDALAVAGII